MRNPAETLSASLRSLQDSLQVCASEARCDLRRRIDDWLADASAAGFHLEHAWRGPSLLVILGGTGTGKSTLLNRLVGHEVSATSFRRTYTGGAVAVTRGAASVPDGWLGIPRGVVQPADLPVRGAVDSLAIAEIPDAPSGATLVDTPDLDGDEPVHHAQADRAFRWAEAVLFVVTPEKYQMTELLGYYRLARRYGVPSLFVMNKCEDSAVLADYARQLAARDWADARVFAVPRDDSAYEPPAEAGLTAVRGAAGSLPRPEAQARDDGNRRRCGDLVERLRDRIVAPMCEYRRTVDACLAALRSLRTWADDVDVTPLTRDLQHRMQEQSVLYLIGPQRVLDRIISVPAMLAKMPRTAWAMMRGRQLPDGSAAPSPRRNVPDFETILRDEFVIVQSRIDDLLRSSPHAALWIEQDASSYADTRLDPSAAARIAEEELRELRNWLQQRWDKSPWDTRAVQKLLKHMPGGERLAKLSEAAPYLLAVIVASHGAVFGPVDLLIVGGYSLATWVGERISNEVTARTRATNRRIAQRFNALAGEQVDRVARWLEGRVPSSRQIAELQRLADAVSQASGQSG